MYRLHSRLHQGLNMSGLDTGARYDGQPFRHGSLNDLHTLDSARRTATGEQAAHPGIQ